MKQTTQWRSTERKTEKDENREKDIGRRGDGEGEEKSITEHDKQFKEMTGGSEKKIS